LVAPLLAAIIAATIIFCGPLGHDNMVGKRISQEFINLKHRHTLAMITDEAMIHLKSLFIVFIKPSKESHWKHHGTFVESRPSRAGTFISINHHCQVNSLERKPSPLLLVFLWLPWLE
jgi:hypothetical protein